MDSDAFHHVIGDLDILDEVTICIGPWCIKIVDGQAHLVSKVANVLMQYGAIKFTVFSYSLGLTTNLLSIEKIANKQVGMYFDAEKIYLIEDTQPIAKLANSLCILIGHSDPKKWYLSPKFFAHGFLYKFNSSICFCGFVA